MIIFEIIFWLSIAVVFHSYVLYPIILTLLSRNKKGNQNFYNQNEKPFVSILMSAFNEEVVIEEKINSIYDTKYPADKFEVLIGSDCSVDKTNEIITRLQAIYTTLQFFPFTERQGKGNIINQVYQKSKGEIIILSDANVMFDENTIDELVKNFKNSKIGLVDTNMQNIGLKREGISHQEKAYISREVIIKNQEGNIWGTMMGPFGGCYAIRRELYAPVPKNFLVDDFYICMKVLENKYQAINNLDAKVYEDVSNNLNDEFRRKIRIATGNFQNLQTFSNLLLPIHKGLSFSFLSHKVLRWISPFFIIISLISLVFLSCESKIYELALIAQIFTFLIPCVDALLKKVNLHFSIFRFVTHFYVMNLALFIGFFKFMKGVESNVWKPTKRNQ
jgi:cellulose synthase/poly-beta-1,6-N-acetylglucosamine synthase-like glycosyltransferase